MMLGCRAHVQQQAVGFQWAQCSVDSLSACTMSACKRLTSSRILPALNRTGRAFRQQLAETSTWGHVYSALTHVLPGTKLMYDPSLPVTSSGSCTTGTRRSLKASFVPGCTARCKPACTATRHTCRKPACEDQECIRCSLHPAGAVSHQGVAQQQQQRCVNFAAWGHRGQESQDTAGCAGCRSAY